MNRERDYETMSCRLAVKFTANIHENIEFL